MSNPNMRLPSGDGGRDVEKSDPAQHRYPGPHIISQSSISMSQDILKGLQAKGALKPTPQPGGARHIAPAPTNQQPVHVVGAPQPIQGLIPKLASVMGSNQLEQQPGQIVSLTAAGSLQQQQQSQPIHPVSIPTPVGNLGIPTAGSLQMASLIRASINAGGGAGSVVQAAFQPHLGGPRASQTQGQTITKPVLRPTAGGSQQQAAMQGLHNIQPRMVPVKPPGGSVVSSQRSGSPAVSQHSAHIVDRTSSISLQPAGGGSSTSAGSSATTVQITIQQPPGGQQGRPGGSDSRPLISHIPLQQHHKAVSAAAAAKMVMSPAAAAILHQQPGGVTVSTAGPGKVTTTKVPSLAHLKQQPQGAGHKLVTQQTAHSAGTIAAIHSHVAKGAKGHGYANLVHSISRPAGGSAGGQKLVVSQQHAATAALISKPGTVVSIGQHQAATISLAAASAALRPGTTTIAHGGQKVVLPPHQQHVTLTSSLSAHANNAPPKTVVTSHIAGLHHGNQHATSGAAAIPIAKVPPQRQTSVSVEHQSNAPGTGRIQLHQTSTPQQVIIRHPAVVTTSAHSAATLFPQQRLATTTVAMVTSTPAQQHERHPAAGVLSSVAAASTSQQQLLQQVVATTATSADLHFGNMQQNYLNLLQYQNHRGAGQHQGTNQQHPAAVLSSGPASAGRSSGLLVVDRHHAPAPSQHYPTTVSATDTPQRPQTPQQQQQQATKASPLPSILQRKRTNDGVLVAKKNIFGSAFSENVGPHHPQQHMESPVKMTSASAAMLDPGRENSQSSTDTASSTTGESPRGPTHPPPGATQKVTDPTTTQVKTEPLDPATAALENGVFGALQQQHQVEASPRKKPRKQMFTPTDDVHDGSSSDDDIVDFFAKVNFKRDLDQANEEVKTEEISEYVDGEGHRWVRERKRPPYSLNKYNTCQWKTRNNHFQRYSDVKKKDSDRLTVNQLANSRGVHQKASGWKLYHLAAQLEDVVEQEQRVLSALQTTQEVISGATPGGSAKHRTTAGGTVEDDAVTMVHELAQANIQRSRLFMESMEEGRANMIKLLNHKSRILEIINKHHSKRPVKKKER